MQIWRMKPDGTNRSRLQTTSTTTGFRTFRPMANRSLSSATRKINASEHPYYKRVYLRLMPITGGTPKVIAYVYGGQGTINVPSWSPDGMTRVRQQHRYGEVTRVWRACSSGLGRAFRRIRRFAIAALLDCDPIDCGRDSSLVAGLGLKGGGVGEREIEHVEAVVPVAATAREANFLPAIC